MRRGTAPVTGGSKSHLSYQMAPDLFFSLSYEGDNLDSKVSDAERNDGYLQEESRGIRPNIESKKTFAKNPKSRVISGLILLLLLLK